jgi:hypothetical protein
MNLSERNKKVAISRWSKLHKLETDTISNKTEHLILKSKICGFLAGDGSVQIRKEKSFYHYQIDFFPDDEFMLQNYLMAIKKIYKKTPLVRRRDNVYVVRITSKVIVTDLKKITSFGLRNWTLPESLFNTKGTKEAWLRAFFSAEAYVDKKSIKIQTINCSGMDRVSKLLSELGIENKLYEYIPKQKNCSKVYIIMITKKDARRKYYNSIGFLHSKKTERLKKAVVL